MDSLPAVTKTSYSGGWTTRYTTDDKANAKLKLHTTLAQFPYGSDGYKTNCNCIAVS